MSELDQLRVELKMLKDRLEIEHVVSGASLYSDMGNPAGSAMLYTDAATLDLSYFFGEEAAALPVRRHFQDNVPDIARGFDATHHQTTNFDIDIEGDMATATSAVRSTLRIKDERCSNAGYFIQTLVRTPKGWRITHQIFKPSFTAGRSLVEEARQRGREIGKATQI